MRSNLMVLDLSRNVLHRRAMEGIVRGALREGVTSGGQPCWYDDPYTTNLILSYLLLALTVILNFFNSRLNDTQTWRH